MGGLPHLCLILSSATLSNSLDFPLLLSAKTLDLIGNLPSPLVFSLPSISLDSSMAGAKFHIHSVEEISPENPSLHSPPPPPAVRNRQTRRRRRNSPLPTPSSDPLRGMRRPRARRERGAKLSEVEERFPVSSTPSPSIKLLDAAPPPALPSVPKSRRRLPISLFLLMLTRFDSNLIFVNFPLATGTCSGYMMEHLSSLMNMEHPMARRAKLLWQISLITPYKLYGLMLKEKKD